MQVSRWDDDLAIRLPAAVVEALNLKEGDEIEIRVVDDRTLEISRHRRLEEAIQRIRSLRKEIPFGWKFDRDEANER